MIWASPGIKCLCINPSMTVWRGPGGDLLSPPQFMEQYEIREVFALQGLWMMLRLVEYPDHPVFGPCAWHLVSPKSGKPNFAPRLELAQPANSNIEEKVQ